MIHRLPAALAVLYGQVAETPPNRRRPPELSSPALNEAGHEEATSMREIYERNELSDGRAVWVQSIKLIGNRTRLWTVVTSGRTLTEAPEIINCRDKSHAYHELAEILRGDVMEYSS